MDKLSFVVYGYRNNTYVKDTEMELKMTEYEKLLSKRDLSCEYFSTLPQSEFKFFHNCTRRNLFLSACFFWDGTFSLREVDQKFLHGGKIGYGYSYLNFVFCYSKVFRLHAILHDAPGAVRLHTGKGPGYCYMNSRGPNCFLLGYVTELY